jgi:serine/threonine-protein kinase 24/25/MST4
MKRRRIMRELLEGLATIHDLGLSHRDIKPDNILLTADGSVKIIDFNMAGSISQVTYTLPAATFPWRPPEVFIEPSHSSRLVDIWSLGIILLEMALGSDHPLRPCDTESEQFQKIMELIYGNRLEPHLLGLDPTEQNIIMHMVTDETLRMSARQCLDHAYFTQV